MIEKQQRGDFNIALNGYRGVCALLVYFYHLGSAGVVPWPAGSPAGDAATYLWSSLRYGVEMFFMISGFVILGSLLRHKTVSGFLQDRFIRIYSAWVPALIAVTVIGMAFKLKLFAAMSPLEALGLFVANLLLLPPLIPLPMIHQVSWSLSYEWVFYLTAAIGVLLYRYAPRRSWDKVLWIGLAALFICAFPRALFFVTGVVVFRHQAWFAQHKRWLGWPVISLLVFLVAWRFTDVGKAHLSYTFLDMVLDGRWIGAVIAFAASLHMFASVCLGASRQFAFLTGRTFQFLGLTSYSFYLWHSLVMSVVKRVVIPGVIPYYGSLVGFVVFAVATLAIAIPVAWASWAIFEVRLAKILRRALARQPALGRAVSAT
jgi:peptidoglycan/LPS O-acetylase OafA/YrhL